MGNVGQITILPVDLRSEEALMRTLSLATDVVNLIGILHERGRQTFQEVHAELPGRIARAARAAGVGRMVQMSALGVSPESPSAYARSKAAGEAAVRAAFPEATVIRPSVVVGPQDGFFNRFAEMARFSPVLPLIGGGKTRFQLVYVGDVADALVAALEREDAPGRTYELGGPEAYTFEQAMRYMLGVIGRRRLLVPLPFKAASFQARFLEWLPSPPLTRDQVELLKSDNVVADGALTLHDLGVPPTPIELVVPDYLARYRANAARVARF
jgi:NADH dehydrogenase